MQFVLSLLLTITVSLSAQGQNRGAPKEWKPPQGPHAEMLNTILIDQRGAVMTEQMLLIKEKIAEVKPDLEQYLLHPDRNIRLRSFDMLVRYSDTPKQYIIDVLETPESPLLWTAMFRYAGTYLKDPAFQDVWADAYVSLALQGRAPYSPDGRAVDYNIYTLDDGSHRRLADAIIPRLSTKLSSFDTTNASRIIALIGVLGNPGDEALIDHIRIYQNNIDSRIAHELDRRNESGEESVRRAKRGIVNACAFALVNLGDPDSFDVFVQDCRHEDLQIRKSRLRLLAKLRPTEDLLWLAKDLLNDENYLTEPQKNQSHAITVPYRYCDAAFHSLSKWFDDFPYRSNVVFQRNEAEIALARIWLTLRLAPGSDLSRE